MTSDRYREWDSAYLLGSLSQSERLEYERHLAECAECQAAVDELAGIPGPLSRVSPADALALVDDEAAADASGRSPDLLPRLRQAAGRIRLRRRRWTAGIIAAVTLAAAVGVAPLAVQAFSAPPSTSYALNQVGTQAINAQVKLVSERWGTRVDADCHYVAVTGYPDASRYALFVTDRNGTSVQVSSWLSSPGEDVQATGTTSMPAAEIASVDIRSMPAGTVVLRKALHG